MLLEAYRDHELALAAADIIRRWADEEPRALWERLKAEGPVKHIGPREVARWTLALPGGAWTAMPPLAMYKGPGCHSSMEKTHLCTAVAKRFSSLPHYNATIHPDALQVDPREVARWCWSVVRTANGGMGSFLEAQTGRDGGRNYQPTTPADRLSTLPTIPATIHPDALQVDPQQLPPGCVVYIDPPYQGTTGYADDLPRAQVLALAMKWAQAGAAVYISEAVPLNLPGWHHIDIAGERKGQKRTFSKQQREVITCNVPPAWVPAVQGVLF